MNRRHFLSVAGSSVLSACSARRPHRALPGVIVESYRSAPNSLDPTAAFSDVAHEMFGRIYSGLLRYDAEGKLAPDLAREYTVSPEAVHLRIAENATWHDGRPVVAADIVESLRRYGSSDYPFSSNFGAIGAVDASRWPQVAIHLRHPSFAILHALTARVVPAHVRDLRENPVGCGFYRVVDRHADDLKLRAHAGYHGVPASIETVHCRTVPDPTTQYLELLAGETDVAEISADLHREASSDSALLPRLRLFSIQSKAIEFLFFNVQRIADKILRQAIASCVDRDEMVRYLYWGNGRVVDSPFLNPFNTQARMVGPNPDVARALLKRAGYDRTPVGVKRRDGTQVEFSIIYNADSVKRGQVAQVVRQSVLRTLGIQARVVPLERGLFETLLFRRDYDCAVYGFSFSADPDDVGNLYLSGSENNVTGFKSSDVDELLARARDLLPGDVKSGCYAEIERILTEELPALPLLSYNFPIAVSRRISLSPPSIIGDTYRFTRDQNLWRLA
ncbi:MAG: ABC transporter substrate-binding protein [Acidobacteriota bacterium]